MARRYFCFSVSVSRGLSLLLRRVDVPQGDVRVLRGGGEEATARRKRDRVAVLLVVLEHGQRGSLLVVEDPHSAVPARCHEYPAIASYAHLRYPGLLHLKRLERSNAEAAGLPALPALWRGLELHEFRAHAGRDTGEPHLVHGDGHEGLVAGEARQSEGGRALPQVEASEVPALVPRPHERPVATPGGGLQAHCGAHPDRLLLRRCLEDRDSLGEPDVPYLHDGGVRGRQRGDRIPAVRRGGRREAAKVVAPRRKLCQRPLSLRGGAQSLRVPVLDAPLAPLREELPLALDRAEGNEPRVLWVQPPVEARPPPPQVPGLEASLLVPREQQHIVLGARARALPPVEAHALDSLPVASEHVPRVRALPRHRLISIDAGFTPDLHLSPWNA
mmetsp:Transcript_10583/g.29899  ORF Transcript_10583/g.29899 Transcript_10583/m.29899 type:complete len:388 (+) Transcript_10583:51-1214(+)